MSKTATPYIGTSGWSYEQWKNDFYAGVPRKDWLSFCAQHFTALEINGTFYHLQKGETFAHWREQTPADFRFAMKANRFLTHNKKLLDPASPIQREQEGASQLGEKLAVVLWQLPGNLKKDLLRLDNFVQALQQWPATRHCIEFRHTSWFDDDVEQCLKQHRIANCQSDAADWPMWQAVTTDLVYIRLHGHTRTYASSYTPAALEKWAQKLKGWMDEERQVHVYFDNDAEGAAPRNALQLLDLMQ
jgi:uncharacterized protein YecE (DUF72 family)